MAVALCDFGLGIVLSHRRAIKIHISGHSTSPAPDVDVSVYLNLFVFFFVESYSSNQTQRAEVAVLIRSIVSFNALFFHQKRKIDLFVTCVTALASSDFKVER